jgi:hypothetical protein
MKGDYKDTGNISRCDNTDAEWYNHSTKRYYCKSCAMRLNSDPFNYRDAQRLFGHNLLAFGNNEYQQNANVN